MDRIARVLLGGSVDEAYVAGMERSLFAVVDDPLKQLSAFFLCIVLSAVVATGGVAASSPAIIIGAMIIAPLMMPIMGTSFAVTRGRPRQALRALAVAAGGALVVVLVACLVTALLPAGVPLAGNVEATSRTAPRLVDLVVAVASGFVGTLLVALPLAATSERIAQGASDERAANAAVRQWLDGSGYESLSVKTADDGVTVEIAGAGPAPSAEDLAALLRDGGVEVGEARVIVAHEVRAPVGS